MIAMLTQGISLGFAAGTQPGPLQIFLFTQTIRGGWRHGIWLILSPLLSDGPIVLFILLVLQGASDDLLRVIFLAGGTFVLYLAWGLWRQLQRDDLGLDANAVNGAGAGAAADLSTPGALRQAVLINALGPGPWVYWATITGPLVIQAWRDAPPTAVGFVVAFYGTFLATMAAQVIVTHHARRLGAGVMRAVLWIGLLVMGYMALQLFYKAAVGY